jgi:hypothetical protein
MASGLGVRGTMGRCYGFWSDFKQCKVRSCVVQACRLLNQPLLRLLQTETNLAPPRFNELRTTTSFGDATMEWAVLNCTTGFYLSFDQLPSGCLNLLALVLFAPFCLNMTAG